VPLELRSFADSPGQGLCEPVRVPPFVSEYNQNCSVFRVRGAFMAGLLDSGEVLVAIFAKTGILVPAVSRANS
jgi:hypothetical protein